MMKSVYLTQALSCCLRGLDLKQISLYFQRNGYEVCDNPRSADLIVLSTCAYSNERSDYSLKMVEKFKKYDAELIVTGCLSDIDPKKLKKIFTGKTIGTKNMGKLDDYFSKHKIKFENIPDQNIATKYFKGDNINVFPKNFKDLYDISFHLLNKSLYRNNTLHYYRDNLTSKDIYYLRVSGGCLGSCSYCAIKKSVGTLRSKPVDVIVSEFKKGLEQGYKDFVMVADDLGAYGLDTGSSFPELLKKIISISVDCEIELRDIHPRWIAKNIQDFEELLKKEVIKTIFSPIQSGNDRILQLMNRYSKVEEMLDNFKRLKKAYPGLSIGTDCIIGFPTETRDDFMDTLHLIVKANIDMGAILTFSLKTGTKAEKIKPLIDEKEINKRRNIAWDFLEKYGYKVEKADILGRSKVISYRKK